MELLMLNLSDTEENHELLRASSASSGFLHVFWVKSRLWHFVFSSYLFFSFAQLEESKTEELNMILQFNNRSAFLVVSLKASCVEILSATWTQQVVNELSMSKPHPLFTQKLQPLFLIQIL